jgi:hypothetical protein
MKYLTHLIFLGVGIWIGFALSECNRTPCPEVKESVTRTIDTTFQEKPVITKSYKPTAVKVIPADTSKPADLKGSAVYIYQDSLIDSNLSLFITDTTAGEILGRGISYKLKVPLQIKETITTTKVLQVPVPQRGLFIGAEIGTNFTVFRIAPEVEYITKNGYGYSYNYDLLNKTHSFGLKKRIF